MECENDCDSYLGNKINKYLKSLIFIQIKKVIQNLIFLFFFYKHKVGLARWPNIGLGWARKMTVRCQLDPTRFYSWPCVSQARDRPTQIANSTSNK